MCCYCAVAEKNGRDPGSAGMVELDAKQRDPMARARGALTETDIEATIAECRASGRRRELADGVNGLAVAITGTGCATFYARYRANGTQRRYKLGQYPGPAASGPTLSLAAARTKSRKIVTGTDEGKDPATDRARKRREAASPDRGTTVEAFGNAWTSGDLLREHGEIHGLKAKASARDDRLRLEAHVYPFIGKRPIVDVTEQEIEHALNLAARAAKKRRGGAPLRAATRFQIYQVMRRLFELAIRPARLRSDNPVDTGLRPKLKPDKLFSFLYPDELARLVRCSAIPPGRRVLYALGAYTGLRLGSLLALRWADVDTTHGTITVLKTKTDLPQIFAQRDPSMPGLASVLVVLARWREQCGRNDADPIVMREDLSPCELDRMAERLRADLECAGVDRSDLFGGDPKLQPIRFHDLRATFVTWAKRAGKGDGWIADRTGHHTPAMMERYKRGARRLVDLGYEPFPDIGDALDDGSGKIVTLPLTRR